MDLEFVVRLALIALGIFFLILSAAGALLELARRISGLEGVNPNPLEGITKLVQALATLFKTLAAAPLWLGLGGFGVVLILAGALLPLNFLSGA